VAAITVSTEEMGEKTIPDWSTWYSSDCR